ncbi:MAG: DUF6473 family protein [Paracoccaceae bacterium]
MRGATGAITDDQTAANVDYQLCKVDGSRLELRGALPDLDRPFIAMLGGSETFGKFVHHPFPELLSAQLGLPVANLGVAHAGLSLFSEEEVLLDIASRSRVTVLQVLGAQNMSNRLYSVHSRRNDRFLGVSPALRELFPSVDFTDVNFTGHLINKLEAASASGFQVLVDELKWAWVQRMRRVLSLIQGEVVLLWVSDRCPTDGYSLTHAEPHFVDAAMLAELEGTHSGLVEVCLDKPQPPIRGGASKADVDAARQLPTQAEHVAIAARLCPTLTGIVAEVGGTLSAAETADQSFSINSGTAVNRSATRP